MKAKFLVFASVLLCGCGHNTIQKIDREDFKASQSELIAISHYSLPLDDEGDQKTAGVDGTIDYSYSSNNKDKDTGASMTMHAYTNGETTGIEKITEVAYTVHADISAIWKRQFVPMYNEYLVYGIGNKKVAEMLENIHASYQSLAREVRSIKAPDSLDPKHVTEVEELKSDLSLAISNRTLGLIEFKLMKEEEDKNMHSELLGIHTENSRKYLNSAEEHLETLDELDPEEYSSKTGN